MRQPLALWLLATHCVLGIALAAQHDGTATAHQQLERSDWFADVSAELERGEYRFSAVEGTAGVWSAPNRAHGFRTRASAAGIEVVPRDADVAPWQLVLSTNSLGRADQLRLLGPTTVRVADDRVEFDHGALTEWFVNDERGLEQGWTIENEPAGDAPLWIGLEIGGDLCLRIDAGARSGVFVDAHGEARLRYTGLLAFDATGRELAARLAPSPHGVGIAIDDSTAIYPLTIDPLLTIPMWTAEADQDFASFGISAATAGDVNGDGYSDVVVGAYGYDNGQPAEGRAFVYLGSAAGLGTNAAWTAESNQSAGFFGRSVATAGDVNGDGYGDVIVGASNYDNGQTDEGRAFVYLGSSTGLATSAAWTAEGDQFAVWFGYSVATAGDVNGDGYSDVIVGAQHYANGQATEGRAYVFLGSSAGLATSAAWTAEGDQPAGFFGVSVAPAGDVNGDGYDDVIVGANAYDNGQQQEGRAFVYLGSSTGLATSADWTAESDQIAAEFGISVATAGDVNGDGYGDVIVGAHMHANGQAREGRAFVYMGSSTGLSTSAAWTAESDQLGALFGFAVATAGDVDGDGYSDVIVGAYQYDHGAGQADEGSAFVYLGSSSGLSADAACTIECDQAGALFGYSLATAGDVNGDGYSDVIVGAIKYDSHGQTDEGRAFLYLGRGAGLSPDPQWTGEIDDDGALLGVSVATAGDVNGDGFSDAIVGASMYGNGQAAEGGAFLFLGTASGLSQSAVWTAEGEQVAADFGASVAAAGDVNGDGYGDVIVGAPRYQDSDFDEGRAFVYLGSSSGLATAPAWTADCNQQGAQLGVCVGSAGDVNGDGYGDVIVGAFTFDHGQPNEGRAFVYLGSSTGLATAAAWTAEGDQIGANFGERVATAGDVNGDGFSDVIVAAKQYGSGHLQEGRAFVYLGSRDGLAQTAAWTAESDQDGALFGSSVAAAGDVNGDGYSDVIVGAAEYDNGETAEGRAFVYLGSSAGPSPTAAWTAESDQDGARFGFSVSAAGDVDGDGYGDVIVGASEFDGGEADEGRAFVYLGSSTGLGATAAWTAESDQTDARLGHAVATAGDVNGDGYGDVIVGAPQYDGSEFDGGAALVYLGNEGRGGWTLAPQQRLANDAAPIALLGRSIDKHEFRIRVDFERDLTGFAWASGISPKARLEWEVRPLHAPLDGSAIESGAEQTITGSPIAFDELVAFHAGGMVSLPFGLAHPVAAGAYHWRARVRTNNPLFPVTPWTTMPWNNVTETKLRAGWPAAVRPDPH